VDNKTVRRLNDFTAKAYECVSFAEFLKLAIMQLHEFVSYDSGMFFCAISRDCSYFKPYKGGNISTYAQKDKFSRLDEYEKAAEKNSSGKEAYVYKAVDYQKGLITIEEPRSDFIEFQKDFYIVCLRIIYKDQFMGEIYLHRSKSNPDFSDEDLFMLGLMQPHVSMVFHIIHTLNAVKFLETSGNEANNTMGICVFDEGMSLTGGNVTGYDMLKITSAYGSSVLYHVKELCSDMVESLQKKEIDTRFSSAYPLKTSVGELIISVLANKLKEPRAKFVVILQYADSNSLLSDYQFKFTKREADIIDALVQGKNNPQIAKQLNISENTVKTHIKNIYKKTGANNRTELAYVLMLEHQKDDDKA